MGIIRAVAPAKERVSGQRFKGNNINGACAAGPPARGGEVAYGLCIIGQTMRRHDVVEYLGMRHDLMKAVFRPEYAVLQPRRRGFMVPYVQKDRARCHRYISF